MITKVFSLNFLAKTLIKHKGFLFFMALLFSMRWSFADHYRVPTGSMLPTIQIGDHLLVNKMAYDLKLPFTNITLMKTGAPQRGEIIVFKSPKNPSINFVKRLIGVPGDQIEIYDGLVKINGKTLVSGPENIHRILTKLYTSSASFEYQEQLGKRTFVVQRIPQFFREQRLSFTVPQGHYFFMGDNRDNSDDSRYWGFVPRSHLKGQVRNVTMSVAFKGIIPKINFLRFGKTLI